MNKRPYVILRAIGGRTERLLGANSGLESLREVEVAVEAAELGAREISDARRDRTVLGAAPRIPITLIKPFRTGGESTDENATAWGVQAVGAHGSKFRGTGVRVAVLDTGIDAGHAAFAALRQKILEQDFTGTGNGDANGHGTHCAGTVFGGEVEGLRIGVAPGIAQALIGKVLDAQGDGTSQQLMDGLFWAIRERADVISMSLGFDFPGMHRQLVKVEGIKEEPATSIVLDAYRQNMRMFDALAQLAAAQNANFARTILIAAAGNESRRPDYEISASPPAAADRFVSVGALARVPGPMPLYDVASFSNARPFLCAPGVGIRSAKSGGGLIVMDGTSMATPHVAGVAALWFEKMRAMNPNIDARTVEGRLMGTCNLDAFVPGTDLSNAGSGIVQAPVP